MLVGELDGDEAAPTYMLRIWGHCQNRRQWIFEGITSQALKALCRYPGEASKLEKALLDTGFVRREGTALVIVDWDIYNATLIASWQNGKRGGRPRKDATDGEDQKPSNNPRDNDRIGKDTIGEEKISNPDRPIGARATPSEPIESPSKPAALSEFEISGLGREQAGEEHSKKDDTGFTIALANVDWIQVAQIAEVIGKRIPPRSQNDRRAWLRYAVMCEELFTEDWLMSSLDEVLHSQEHRRSRQAHLVAILKSKASQLGFSSGTFDGIARRIEIPAHVWKSQVLELSK